MYKEVSEIYREEHMIKVQIHNAVLSISEYHVHDEIQRHSGLDPAFGNN